MVDANWLFLGVNVAPVLKVALVLLHSGCSIGHEPQGLWENREQRQAVQNFIGFARLLVFIAELCCLQRGMNAGI